MSMIRNDLLAKIAGFGFFYRWHPEVALRYLPIVSELKKLPQNVKVLEVGSAGLGIAPYLRRDVTGVDTNFSPPYHKLLKRIKASATYLPLEDNSFDCVISVDMLEHLDKKNRAKAISEMLRVASKEVIIAVPCGRESLNQDLKLDKYYKNKTGHNYHFLREQIDFGLPDQKDIHDTISKMALALDKNISIKVSGNENLNLREILMKGWMSQNLLINFFFRKLILFFLPILKNINQEPTYRRIFYIYIR